MSTRSTAQSGICCELRKSRPPETPDTECWVERRMDLKSIIQSRFKHMRIESNGC